MAMDMLPLRKICIPCRFQRIRQILWLKATDTTIQVFHHHEMVAIHSRLSGAGHHSTLDDHMPPNALAYKLRHPQWCLTQEETIEPACLQLIRQLFSHRVLDHLRAVQGGVRLVDRYGNQRLEATCARALFFDSPRYRTVKTILENNQEQAVVTPDTSLPGIYGGNVRFQRNTNDLIQ